MAYVRKSRPRPKNGPIRLPDGDYLHRYGLSAPEPLPDWQLEMICWRERWDCSLSARGFREWAAQSTLTPKEIDEDWKLSPAQHLHRCIQITQPSIVWQPWMERRFSALCDDEYADRVGDTIIRNLPWVGCGSAGKTWDSGVIGFWFWLAHLGDSSVALTSTGKQKMRQRVWSTIQECWREAQPWIEAANIMQPHMLNSTMELQAEKGDSKHAIFAQAVETGEVAKAVERLKGVHCGYVMLVIDEAPGTPEAIFQTIPNMSKGCKELVVIPTGNGPLTHYDCFSRVCKPVQGWSSINKEMDEWRTAAVPEFQLPSGRCLHFSGRRSPNVLAGKTLYPFLYSWENWQRVLRNPEILRTAQGISQDEGFWPPEGFLRTVLSEEMIEIGGARGLMPFAGPTQPIASVDPAFGGDKCIFSIGRMGPLADGKLAIQLDEQITVPIVVDARDEQGRVLPADYQIVNYITPELRKRNIRPDHFGVEATGTGRGVAAIFMQEFGEVVAVESGGKPTDLPASEEDPGSNTIKQRPAYEVYDRKITELWFSVQGFVKGCQIGGLNFDICEEFCARLYDYKSKKYILEKKGGEETDKTIGGFKQRFGRSPDASDSFAIMVHVARLLGMATKGPRGNRMASTWDKLIETQQELYKEENLYQEETQP